MKLDVNKFAIAGGITAGALWIICLLMAWLMSTDMMSMSGYMMHGDHTDMYHQMGFGSMLLCLIGVVLVGAIICWIFAFIYNKLIGAGNNQ